nr:hypothetical protein GCM10020063_044370 [Dactylosporangium thailandense]
MLFGPMQPVLRITADHRYPDLRHGPRLGAGLFTDDFLVIAKLPYGHVAVRTTPPHQDLIVALEDEQAHHRASYEQAGYTSPEEHICAELLTPLAPDIQTLTQHLQPVALDGGRSTELVPDPYS